MPHREFHYWIATRDTENGNKPYLIYACPAREGEDAARRKALEILSGLDFSLKRYPTREIGRASQMLKGSRLESTHSLTESSKRLGHDKSMNRLRQKRAARQARRYQ